MDEPGPERPLGLGDGFGQHRLESADDLIQDGPGAAGAHFQGISWATFIAYLMEASFQSIVGSA
jgi:hypothetical protein